MLPEVWGKYAWPFLHLVTLAYPDHPTEEDKENYYHFFMDLKNVLPCEKCRVHFAEHLRKYPLNAEALSSRKTLVLWLIDIHNVINYYTGKEMLSYNEAINEISKLTKKEPTPWFFYGVLLVTLIAVIVFFRSRH